MNAYMSYSYDKTPNTLFSWRLTWIDLYGRGSKFKSFRLTLK